MNLVLYQFPQCPFCQIVLQAIPRLGLNDHIDIRDTRANPEHREALVTLTGRTQVPCLVIDGEPMHESADILDWLSENQGQIHGS